ncbi:uncharacterized protein LOC113798555 [Dermatophagoides pteronyssinus]|uniref:uncharacterized protein LOC113798555 n=1 Tax=Dermatophagoides pteronyssinus TaxID=6956 RepID=UPI003F68074A
MKIIVSFFIAINVIAFFTIVDARNLLKTNNSSIVHNNGMPEHHVPISVQTNSMNQTEKSTSKNDRQSLGDEEHYVKVGNFSIPKEFFSPESQGFMDLILKGFGILNKFLDPDENKGSGGNNQSPVITNIINISLSTNDFPKKINQLS